jgi:hypothetical protein
MKWRPMATKGSAFPEVKVSFGAKIACSYIFACLPISTMLPAHTSLATSSRATATNAFPTKRVCGVTGRSAG